MHSNFVFEPVSCLLKCIKFHKAQTLNPDTSQSEKFPDAGGNQTKRKPQNNLKHNLKHNHNDTPATAHSFFSFCT